MSENRIIYLVSFIFFLILIPISLFFFFKGFEKKESFNEAGIFPNEIKVEKIMNGYQITWKTEDPAYGYLVWGTTLDDLSNNTSDENSSIKIYRHTANITTNSKEIYYKIYSNDKMFDDNGKPFKYLDI